MRRCANCNRELPPGLDTTLCSACVGTGGTPREAHDHPDHYGGKDNPYEAIKVIEAWGLDFCLGNTLKYISRAGKKDPTKLVEDLKKARWYLTRRINQLGEP